MSAIDIDALYKEFGCGLPAGARSAARSLAATLGLAPNTGIPWSAVFKHEVTLAAPGLFAAAMPRMGRAEVEQAVLAHMLSVIEAFGTDRIADRQAPETPELKRLLSLMRGARDEALVALAGTSFREIAREADRRTHDAILEERELLLRGEPVSVEEYARVSAGKQDVGIPASLALASRADWPREKRAIVRSTLLGVWLGLQFQDDVADWEDDAERGGAWAVVLARRSAPGSTLSDRAILRRLVLSSGVQAEMLELARRRYLDAATGAETLGAQELARWARERATEAQEQSEGERRHPGYVARLRSLGAWKAEVLA